MQLTPKKLFKYGLIAVLVTGVILALGFLSFTGMLALCGLVGVAIGSFALTGMIEGEVYTQNIIQGVEKLLKGKWLESKYLKNAIYLRELNKLLHDHNIEQSKFLERYSGYAKHLEDLQIEKEKLGLLYFLSGEFKRKLERAEKLLRDEQKYFIAFMEGNVSLKDDGINEIVTQAPKGKKIDLRQGIINEIAEKHAISPWCLAGSVVAGLGMGLVFFSVAPESIVAAAAFFGIALSSSAFPLAITIIIAVFAVIAAVGYAVLIYNTLTDMLQNDAVREWKDKIKEFFSSPKEGVTPKFVVQRVFGAIAVVLLVGLCIFATVTTAGTWWFAAKAGAISILPRLQNFAALLSGPMVVVMGVAQLGFNFYNSLKSVDVIKSFIQFIQKLNKISLDSVKEWYEQSTIKKDYLDQENKIQFMNPFRFIALLIALPFKLLVFVGHVIASAAMGDRFEPIPPVACLIPGALVETGSDASYFFEKSHESHEGAKKHHHEEHSHSHTDIPGKVLFVVLSPLYFLSAVWDWSFSQSNKEPLKPLSFKEAIIRSFFGVDALDALDKVKNMPDLKIDKPHQKVLSAYKIHRMLLNSDKAKEFTEGDRKYFGDLLNNRASVGDIFGKDNVHNPVLLSKSAVNFLTKLRFS